MQPMSSCRPRIAWIVPTAAAGGIGPVALETTLAAAALNCCDVTLIETHASPRCDAREQNGLRRVALDMAGTNASAGVVLDWLKDNPQDVVFTNGVSHLEGIFSYIPENTLHVAVLHDSARSYRAGILSYARYLDGVVAISDYVYDFARRDLRAAGFSGLVRRIHNGTSYPPAPARVGSAGPLRLLFIGNMWLKGGDKLAGIAKALHRRSIDFRLTIIGKETAWLERRFVRSGLREKVSWMPRQPREELWRTYAAHDALLMLSWGEPFGMVTIEAMGMGCVPVAYDVPSGTQDIVEPGINGFLVAPNREAVAAALADLTPARLAWMSAEASQRARTQFSARQTAQDYVQLVGDLMRCRSLIHRSRLSPGPASLTAESPSRSALVRVYHALPPSWRRRIRNALAAYPTGARRLREWL
jgi:glycosyltransferase involved in cell wall biosynthesis